MPLKMQKTLYARRIGGSLFGKDAAIYKFEAIKRAKATAKARYPKIPILDLGVGEPDAMAHPSVIKALQAEVEFRENRGYPDNGGPLFKAAVKAYMEQVFHVTLNPNNEIMHSIGAKAALTLLPAAFINPGDIVLMTVPGYPVFGTHTHYYGGTVYPLPLLPENNFLPDLKAIPRTIAEKTKAIVLNYPNNPTGACATREFFEEVVAWARHWEVLIIHDAAYAGLVYENEKPLSILSIIGAKERCIEIHSLSKAFNMTGWRLGWVCGGAPLIQAYAHVKDNSDSGQFLAIQAAGAIALGQPKITQETALKYERRMKALIEILNKIGFNLTAPKAGFFLYAPSPKGVETSNKQINFPSAAAFSTWLIENALVSTVPWDEAGAFIRFCVTFEAKDIEAETIFFETLKERLQPFRFIF